MHVRQQVAIRGRQHTNVDRPRAVLTDAPHLALLQHAQQLDLHGRRHIANFIEEQRAAIRGFEESRAVLRRARERAAGVSEELGLQQGLGYSGAIDREKRAGRPRRFIMNEARDALLAGAAFAGNQDRGIDLRDAPGQIERPQHCGTRRVKACRRRGIDLPERATGAKLPFLLLELVRQLRQRDIQAGLLLVEREMRREVRTPFLS